MSKLFACKPDFEREIEGTEFEVREFPYLYPDAYIDFRKNQIARYRDTISKLQEEIRVMSLELARIETLSNIVKEGLK